ncbi:Putative HMP/thiamine import ATP-binding protein YkoD [uncultured Roseburia sp.]|uniref:ABC transporter ATP-binding protein n=1 Tax=Brotonthovivens ammoniilytica TaxID=2981725 RepID=A0ABT2TK72_9FIRM|nr:ABC transporter ATP-binding protein [Brotonthovivens ammoniilytica]MCU6762507.1 ABC transporter ATP-binding protein [Brotonthovivens ammoniilytica]SCI74160.1 Putative HMP/thiamine import ATP-binding protein YkoD [uncultured Roseburia sp.]
MIRFEHVNFQYTDSDAGVADICLHVREGECVVLTGPSGNGKTTLIRLVNGLAPTFYTGRFSGCIQIDGKDRSGEPLWKRGKTVGSVFQDPGSQFFSSEMLGEVAFGCENYGFPHEKIVLRTNTAIRRFHLEQLRSRSLDVLSSGEKQRTAVASVYAMNPPVYVCDEPTANLDGQGVEELRETLQSLHQEGSTLLIAEHRLFWLMDLADRFVYIRDGAIQWECTPEQMRKLSSESLERLELRAVRQYRSSRLSSPTGIGTPILSLQGLCCKRGKHTIWENLNLAAWAGQIIAITGCNGAGKTTLAKIVAGLERPSKGSIFLHGLKIGPTQRRKSCWYSSNDTGTHFFTNSVTEELLLGVPRTEERLEKARNLLKKFGLYPYKDAHPVILSGGQKQRLSIACGLLSGRELLLLDEPTSGLDGGNMRKIASSLAEAAAEGKTILVITHDEELIQACCDFRWELSG